MKTLLRILIGIAGLVGIAWCAGLILPRDHVAARSAHLDQPPAAVWALISDYAGYGSWAPEVTSVRRLPDRNGHPVWSLEGDWAMPLEIEVLDPPRRLVARIADPNLPFGGTWTWEVAPDSTGTMITCTERGHIKPALLRTLTRFVFGYTSTIDAYLKAMGKRFGQPVSPMPVV